MEALRLLIADDENVRLLQDIADAKKAPQSARRLEEIQRAFGYITDLRSAEERGRIFVDLMERGALYAVQ